MMSDLKSLKSFQSQFGFFRSVTRKPSHHHLVTREYIYVQFYFTLKGQKTVLNQLLSLLQKEIDQDPPDIKKIKENVRDQVKEILDSTYIKLILNIEDKMFLLNQIIRQLPTNKELSVCEKILKAVLLLNRISKSFTLERTQETEKQEEEQDKKNQNYQKYDGSTVVCRICGEKIPVNYVEEHTNLCISAFKNESKLKDIDHKLQELQNQYEKGELNVEWPGEEKRAETVLFPLLNAFAILLRISDISPDQIDGADELALLASFAKSLGANDVCYLALEKRRCCLAFAAAAEKLHRTAGHVATPKQPYLSEFTFLKRISGGAYARVFLARKTNTNDIYAVKVLKRRDVTRKNQVQNVFMERDILLGCESPYIVSFFYSIPGLNNLYLFMEYLPGGDLFSLLEQVGCLDEPSARVYTRQIIEALRFLHGRGIIHRDLKPDNILIAADGTLKLTDFGLSYAGAVGRQVSSEKIVGTADYVAPEVVMCLPHGPCSDYWSLGCIVYELVCGMPPFHRDTEQQTYDAILKGIYEAPEDVSDELVDFISKLLNPDPEKRLGANGIDEIVSHPWLKDPETAPLPFIPSLNSPIDTEYFHTRYEFTEEDENDIKQDIEESLKTIPSMSPRRNRSRTVAVKDQMDEFSSVSVEQLGKANVDAVKRIRRTRAVSDNCAPPASPPKIKQQSSLDQKGMSIIIPEQPPKKEPPATAREIQPGQQQLRTPRLQANDDFSLPKRVSYTSFTFDKDKFMNV